MQLNKAQSYFPLLLGGLLLSAQAQTPIRHYGDPMPDAKLNAIPNLVLPALYKDRVAHPLPKMVDNTKSKYMSPMGWAIGAEACGSASAVSYIYSYEVEYQENI